MNIERSYDIIRSSHVSEKSTSLLENNKHVFIVRSDINKAELKQAIQLLYGVEVLSVNIVNIQGRKKRFRGRQGVRSSQKKAIISFPQGVSLDLNSYN